jgi:hypothetical protein
MGILFLDNGTQMSKRAKGNCWAERVFIELKLISYKIVSGEKRKTKPLERKLLLLFDRSGTDSINKARNMRMRRPKRRLRAGKGGYGIWPGRLR